MTFRFPLSFPSRAEGTILPGVLASVLVIALVIQLVSADREPDLPPVLAIGASRVDFDMPAVPPVSTPPVIFDRPLFAPRQSLVAGPSNKALPLGGALVAGTVAIRGRAFAVIRRANVTVSNIAIGGAVDGWRLIALRPEGAVFVKNNVRHQIAYGATRFAAVEENAPDE